MNLIPTELNQRLSQWVQNRIAADHSLIGGRIIFWKLVGVGLVAFGLGAAVGIGFFGYSFIARNGENITVLSATFSKALAEARLNGTAEGTVQLEPREISFASNQMIALDPNSRVLLDPASKVLAEGNVRVHAPATAPRSRPPQAERNEPIANFTVFKRVLFEKGAVMTGWNFVTSTQQSPTEEYCYYTVESGTPGVGVRVDLGTNQRLDAPKTLPKDFDAVAAFKRCVWFRSENQ
jgi:hypothetical protein